jgi:hypothetical protein
VRCARRHQQGTISDTHRSPHTHTYVRSSHTDSERHVQTHRQRAQERKAHRGQRQRGTRKQRGGARTHIKTHTHTHTAAIEKREREERRVRREGRGRSSLLAKQLFFFWRETFFLAGTSSPRNFSVFFTSFHVNFFLLCKRSFCVRFFLVSSLLSNEHFSPVLSLRSPPLSLSLSPSLASPPLLTLSAARSAGRSRCTCAGCKSAMRRTAAVGGRVPLGRSTGGSALSIPPKCETGMEALSPLLFSLSLSFSAFFSLSALASFPRALGLCRQLVFFTIGLAFHGRD